MQRLTRWKMMFSACLAAALLTAPARAEDKKPAAKALDRSTLDESIYQNLRGIIDHGANLYNQGDWNGCYRVWEGALMSLKPLLDHRPKLQEAIDGGLTNARQDAMLWHRAWVLRPVLDKIRADIDADHPHRKKDEKGNPIVSPEPKKPTDTNGPVVSPKPKPKTLWDRLGGEAGVTKIVDDFVNAVVEDPKVDFFRHNKVKLDAEHIVKMKREFVEQISQATGGPLKYTGPDMKKIHKDMGITNEQFNAAAADLKKALEKNKVGAEDMKKILAAVDSYRKEIVQPKKPEDKKPQDKKPVQKKPQDKKPQDKKPQDKKPTEPKPAEKKPTDKKPDDKKPAGNASVAGKVLYKGILVAGGTIAFVGKDGKYKGSIAADGAYKLTGVKAGEYKIGVSTTGAKFAVRVPVAYTDPDKSGLTYTAKKGQQILDIELK